ncbi:MAG: GTP-binding protein HSR1 [Sulfobacillus acidophilus]|uniref:Ribosome biogenesis GTPase A n=1 Tax=Sulfobacillus acidophilus TaxID=53633 RepID=A0A2T2WHY6_9FIRM|nr:MAG: GTP-binding protein HSR1 [Sulfobacillus acidophilus]
MSGRGWYPGHMVATQATIRELSPYLSAFIEVVDARAPELTRHRPLQKWVGRAPTLLALNKSDLADPKTTQAWIKWYRRQKIAAVAFNAQTQEAQRRLFQLVTETVDPPYRLAVVGLPNLGKSTILNRMVGKRRVATGAKPGITRGPQWIRLDNGWEWLDLPGVVTPSKSRDWRLKLLGVVPVEVDEAEDIASRVWVLYHPAAKPEDWVRWGQVRGYLRHGGEVDRQRTAQAVLAEFRRGAWGPISLQKPGEVS